MTDHKTQPETSAATSKYSTINFLFWSVLGISTLIRLVYALKLPLTGDEAYFWEWGRHPALGYYDHPPVAGWILWITRQIFGETAAAVRLPAVFTGTMIVAVIHRFTLEITGSTRAAALTGLLATGIPVISVLGVIYSTDTPVLAAGTLGGYFFYRAVDRGEKRAWIWTGICFAIVAGSKFLGVPLLAASAIYLTLNPGGKTYLRSSGPWIAIVIALFGFLPVVIWNASNDWATFAFNFATRHSSALPGIKGLMDYMAGQAFALSPMVFLLSMPLLASSAFVWREYEDTGKGLTAFMALAPIGGFFLISPLTMVGIHWTAVAVPFLVIALGIELTAGIGKKAAFLSTTLLAWIITLTLFLLPLIPSILPADWAWPLRPDKINTAQLKKVMDSPRDTGRLVGQVIEEIEGEGRAFTFTTSYALSSMVAFYTPGNPQVTVLGRGSVHGRNHLLWFDPADHIGKNAVYVSYKSVASKKDFLNERFERSQTVVDAAGPEGSLVSVVKCYGYKGIR